MKRARIISLVWVLINVIGCGALLLALAGTIDLTVTTHDTIETVALTAGALVADWLLRHAQKSGWYLLFALLLFSAGNIVAEFLIDPEFSIGATAVGLLILAAFAYQLNHSTVRACVNLKPSNWPGQAILNVVNRIIVYLAGAVVLAELFLGWEIGILVLIVLLSREFYRGMKYGIHGSQA